MDNSFQHFQADSKLISVQNPNINRLQRVFKKETTALALDSSEDAAEQSESYSSTLIIVESYRKLAANLR